MKNEEYKLWQAVEKQWFITRVAKILHGLAWKLKDYSEFIDKAKIDLLTQRPILNNPNTGSDAITYEA